MLGEREIAFRGNKHSHNPRSSFEFWPVSCCAANTVMITTKHISDFDAHLENKDEGKSDEIPQQFLKNC